MKKVDKNKTNKLNSIIICAFLIALAFMSIGFASYNKLLNFSGTAVVKPDGRVYIKSVTKGTHTNATSNPQRTNNNTSIDFNLSFTTHNTQNETYVAVFNVVIANESSYDYVYHVPDYSPTLSKGNSSFSQYIDYEVNGIRTGDTILSHTEASFTITFTMQRPENGSGTYNVDGDFTPPLEEDTSASIMGVVDTSVVGDLRGNNELTEFTMHVMNTYNVQRSFTIEVDSDKFVTRNLENTGVPSHTIEANSDGDFRFYIAKKDDAEFIIDREKVKVMLVPTGESGIKAGIVTILVDITNTTYVDETPPTISNVSASMENTEGSATVTWDGEDESNVQFYTIIAYKDGTEVERANTQDGETETYTFTGLAAGSYYFVVIGTDDSNQHNTASATDIQNATSDPGYASKSETQPFKWRFTVQNNSNTSNVYFSGNNYALLGQDYTATIYTSNTSDYNALQRGNITIKMGEEDAYSNYEYDESSHILTIHDVSDNIEITASPSQSWCLVKGTKILLANGKYKNIEDIKYTDLLKVYDHVNGGLTEVYPIWIEEGRQGSKYRKISFSDGSYLKIVSNHSIYDVDKRTFIDASNDDECKIGTRVYKVKNGKLEIVKVTKIEDIEDTVYYYNVVSTVYYNLIANDLLTANWFSTVASNVYGYEGNAIYGENYYKISNGKKLSYNYVRFIPHYLYKGLNLQNARSLIGTNIDVSVLKLFVDDYTLSPEKRNGKRYFMMTTSLDNVSDENVNNFLYKEGSKFTLPKTGAKYFVDTATNIKYNPGETVKVEMGTHFRAIN